MEITIALAISILGVIISVISFALSRKDKAIKDTKESHQDLIEYQLKELKEDVKEILSKLDKYENDIDIKIDKAMKNHLEVYHNLKGVK